MKTPTAAFDSVETLSPESLKAVLSEIQGKALSELTKQRPSAELLENPDWDNWGDWNINNWGNFWDHDFNNT